MKYFILFDTETTGNAEEDRIIQFGSIILDQKGETECYDEMCKSDVDIKLEAMEVHNITPEMLEDKPSATQTKFYGRIQELNDPNNYLIAHNIKFDLGMIKKEGFEPQMKMIDTLRCSKHLFDDLSAHRLQYLRYALDIYKTEKEEADKLGIEIKAHDAIGDVLVMKLLLSKLVEKAREKYANEAKNTITKMILMSRRAATSRLRRVPDWVNATFLFEPKNPDRKK